jgi:hypothetical protein
MMNTAAYSGLRWGERTPSGYPLAERLGARIEEVAAEQEAGVNPLGLLFPSPRGKLWRSSNFQRNVLAFAYRTAGRRCIRGRPVGVAQPPPRLLHHGPVHLEARPDRRVPDGRSRQLPDHPRHVRRHHRRHPRPSPRRHRLMVGRQCQVSWRALAHQGRSYASSPTSAPTDTGRCVFPVLTPLPNCRRRRAGRRLRGLLGRSPRHRGEPRRPGPRRRTRR